MTDDIDRAAKRREGEIAAGGEMNVALKVGGDGLTKAWCGLGEDAAGTGKRVG